MRWLTFIMLAMLTLCVQTTLAPALGIRGVHPDFMLILLVHYALHAQAPAGLTVGWVLGLMVNLTSVETQGVVMLVYGLASLVIWSIRDLTFTRHVLTHLCLTACCCLTVHLALRSYSRIACGGDDALLGMVWISVCSALYTGLLAVPIHRLLLRYSRVLGLRGARKDAWTGVSTMRRMSVV